jgi:oxygen-independent coproporphyrinogen-3 oxidase
MTPISVYVHIPFCTVKCGYCDFNAYSGLDVLKAAYAQALVGEVRAAAPMLRDRTVTTVAFGGGTPSEVPASTIAAVLEALRAGAGLHDGAEVSLEANPATSDGPQLRALRAAGVTRVSFGVQSFNVAELRFLDRLHSPEAAAASVANARSAGFESIGLDLIYGLPGQSMAEWEASLSAAIALAPDHISTYALSVEDGTPLGRRVRLGQVTPLDGDVAADMYERAGDLLGAEGYEQYELSNWSRPGHRSRHNSVYWSDGDYLGIGAGAHGYYNDERYENIAHPNDYIAAVKRATDDEPRPALGHVYTPDRQTAMFDWVMLRLRLLAGFEPSAFEARFGRSLETVFGPALFAAVEAGVLELAPSVRLTRRGRLLHGELAANLLAHISAV